MKEKSAHVLTDTLLQPSPPAAEKETETDLFSQVGAAVTAGDDVSRENCLQQHH